MSISCCNVLDNYWICEIPDSQNKALKTPFSICPHHPPTLQDTLPRHGLIRQNFRFALQSYAFFLIYPNILGKIAILFIIFVNIGNFWRIYTKKHSPLAAFYPFLSLSFCLLISCQIRHFNRTSRDPERRSVNRKERPPPRKVPVIVLQSQHFYLVLFTRLRYK